MLINIISSSQEHVHILLSDYLFVGKLNHIIHNSYFFFLYCEFILPMCNDTTFWAPLIRVKPRIRKGENGSTQFNRVRRSHSPFGIASLLMPFLSQYLDHCLLLGSASWFGFPVVLL